MEAEATFTLQQVGATAFFLYMCMATSLLYYVPSEEHRLTMTRTAPFAIDLVKKIF